MALVIKEMRILPYTDDEMALHIIKGVSAIIRREIIKLNVSLISYLKELVSIC
jgi:hypothetical protein